jgi:mycothiol synthase
VLDLVAAAAHADGISPLDEHALLHVRHGGDRSARHVLVVADGRAIGYAHLDVTDAVDGASAQLVVDPAYRRRGLGRRLVEHLLRRSPDGRLRLWAHGEHADAAGLAGSLGFTRARALRQMRRSLRDPLPPAELPSDTTVRTFRPGEDDEAWMELNAAAFAGHPEQGRWTIADLHRRMDEAWFDPSGFFLAERDGRLVGFHWTKIHGGVPAGAGHGHAPIGEVYVVGVRPSARGGRLGRALTLIGLEHLRERGLPQAMLYVDADNASAVRLYESLGFTTWDIDVMYARA